MNQYVLVVACIALLGGCAVGGKGGSNGGNGGDASVNVTTKVDACGGSAVDCSGQEKDEDE